MNQIIEQESNLASSSIEYNPFLTNENFVNIYFSLKMGVGIVVSPNWVLDLNYEHSLQNIYVRNNEIPISKMVPFQLGLSLSYYLLLFAHLLCLRSLLLLSLLLLLLLLLLLIFVVLPLVLLLILLLWFLLLFVLLLLLLLLLLLVA